MNNTDRYFCLYFMVSSFWTARVHGSVGDQTPFFKKCWETCRNDNCTTDGSTYKPESKVVQPPINQLLFWECTDECKYECMWKTVHALAQRKWDMPQFFGKWPFIRVFGIQELGSVIGSLLNLLVHIFHYSLLRKQVYKNHPLFWLWRVFFLVCFNGWIWSIIFHTRDTYFTEFMDYACAFSMVLVVFYCFGMRVLHGKTKMWGLIFSSLCATYYLNHVIYLYSGKIDYGYNMAANIAVGTLGGVGWLVWSCVQWWRGKRYVWRCIVFIILTVLSTLFELWDFPPQLKFWDAHAIWHLLTVPLPFYFYRFIIDDCNQMRMKKI